MPIPGGVGTCRTGARGIGGLVLQRVSGRNVTLGHGVFVCLFVCFAVFQRSVVDVALPRMDPTLPVGRQTWSSSCAGNRPLPLQGARGICCFGALAGCRLAAQSIIVPTPLGMLG